MNYTELQKKANLFKALGHPSRLFIMETLNHRGTLCVCELTQMLQYDISTISKHLNKLKENGLVSFEKHGNKVMYKSLTPCLSKFLDCINCSV